VWKRVLPRCGNYGACVVCYLTNRWHFAAVCSVIDKQMMSWCGKNKKVALSRQGECGIYLLYVIKKLKRDNDKFVFKSFGALKHSGKVFARHLTWCMIRTKQTTLLVRRASQRDVIVLGIDYDIPSLKWRQPFVCPLVDHSSWPMKRQNELWLLLKIYTYHLHSCCSLGESDWNISSLCWLFQFGHDSKVSTIILSASPPNGQENVNLSDNLFLQLLIADIPLILFYSCVTELYPE
jgi:hypothetical protein